MQAAATVRPREDEDAQWFGAWFDSFHYHKLYAHRDEAEAAGFVEALIQQLQPAQGAEVLDLGCGAGRHAKELASRGLRVTGLDLAASSIREARRWERPGLRFAQHDMRVPFGQQAFDYVFNFFTSFGYFDAPDEHLTVVSNMARTLHVGGRLVLDYLSVPYADAHLIRDEVKTIDGVVFHLTRWTDAGHFFKRIAIEDPSASGGRREYVERVARFTLADFECMFAPFELRIEEVYGDYRLRPYDVQTSPRLILVARKMGEVADVGDIYFREEFLRERFLRTRLTVSGDTPRYDASIH